jgi:hypothetical protein
VRRTAKKARIGPGKEINALFTYIQLVMNYSSHMELTRLPIIVSLSDRNGQLAG